MFQFARRLGQRSLYLLGLKRELLVKIVPALFEYTMDTGSEGFSQQIVRVLVGVEVWTRELSRRVRNE